MLVGEYGADEAKGDRSLGKMPTTLVRRLISLLSRSSGLLDQTFLQWSNGNGVNARTSPLAERMEAAAFGSRASSWSATSSQRESTSAGVSWANTVRNAAETMSVLARGTVASRLRA